LITYLMEAWILGALMIIIVSLTVLILISFLILIVYFLAFFKEDDN